MRRCFKLLFTVLNLLVSQTIDRAELRQLRPSFNVNVTLWYVRAQTSSLNVGAAEYPSRGRASIDLLAIEPSAAPRRRALPASTSRQGTVSGGGNRGEDGTLSPSLISAAMASSAASVLASSPPASRAGALSRAPTARGSLSNSNPFERAPASMLNLDETYMSEYPESTPGVVPVSRPADMALPGISRHVRPPKDEPQGPEGMSSGGGQNGDGAEGEAVLDETKLDADRRELMRRQQVHPSFRADAPVSLEQASVLCSRFNVCIYPCECAQEEGVVCRGRVSMFSILYLRFNAHGTIRTGVAVEFFIVTTCLAVCRVVWVWTPISFFKLRVVYFLR